ncbi:MAG: clan AA aspartic protease [Planctomycetes bacterium]|nr:clan AA aspartic protease [Planctomycetota bacterium]
MQCDTPPAERPSSGFLRPFSVFAHAARFTFGALGVLAAPAFAQDEWPEQDPVTAFVEGCKTALTGGAGGGPNAGLLTGKGTLWGAPCDVQLLVQPGARYLFELKGGFELVYAITPQSGWELDPTGAQWPSELGDLERRRWVFAVMSGDWLADPEITVEPIADDGESELTSAKLARAGGCFDALLTVHRSSLLPAKLVLTDGAVTSTIEYSSWSEGPGHLWPMRTVIDGASSGVVIGFESFTPPPHYLVDPFQRNVPLADVAFDEAVAPDVECKLATSGHVLVHPRVDGKDVGWFLFDSGASMLVLSPKARAELGLAAVGKRTLQGPNSPEAALLRASALTIGPLTVSKPLFVEIDLARVSAATGVELAGIVGSDLLRRAVVELDREAPSFRVKASDGYALEGATWTPVRFDRHAACVEARFDGGAGLLKLDVGPARELVLHAPAVRALGLLDKPNASLAAVGDVRLDLAWLEVGGLRAEKVPALLSSAASGPFSSRATAGVLPFALAGSPRIVFDLAARRVAFLRRPK